MTIDNIKVNVKGVCSRVDIAVKVVMTDHLETREDAFATQSFEWASRGSVATLSLLWPQPSSSSGSYSTEIVVNGILI